LESGLPTVLAAGVGFVAFPAQVTPVTVIAFDFEVAGDRATFDFAFDAVAAVACFLFFFPVAAVAVDLEVFAVAGVACPCPAAVSGPDRNFVGVIAGETHKSDGCVPTLIPASNKRPSNASKQARRLLASPISRLSFFRVCFLLDCPNFALLSRSRIAILHFPVPSSAMPLLIQYGAEM
jgi:hypothetical protein